MVLAKLIGQLGQNRRWGKPPALRLAAADGDWGGRVGLPLLPLVAKAIEFLPLLSEPLLLGLVHGLESPRTAGVPRRFVEQRAHDVAHG